MNVYSLKSVHVSTLKVDAYHGTRVGSVVDGKPFTITAVAASAGRLREKLYNKFLRRMNLLLKQTSCEMSNFMNIDRDKNASISCLVGSILLEFSNFSRSHKIW